MSLQNLLTPNNETIYCKELVTDTLNVDNIKTDSIELGSILTIPSTPLSFYFYQSSLNGDRITYGGAVPDALSTSLRAVRIGNFVSMIIGMPSSTPCSNASSALNFLIPEPFRPSSIAIGGLCLVRKGGTTNLVARWALGGSILSVYAGVPTTGFWTLGEAVGPGSGTFNFTWVI